MSNRLYYWKSIYNFGDLLSVPLLKHFARIDVEWSPPETATLTCVGSVLQSIDPGFTGIIAGSGKLHERTKVDFPKAKIMGLRGPLTARGVKGDFALGDPAILANELVWVEKKHNLGIVPHWSDKNLEHRPDLLKYNPLIIRPNQEPLEVLRQIGSCRKIVASSLHGIIVADAFGIPRRIEMTERFAREGGSYKFDDHNAAVHLKTDIGVTQAAPRHYVQDLQHEVFDMLEDLGRLLVK